MDFHTSEIYWLAITQIEAQELLIQLRVVQYPWMSKEGRRQTHRQFHKLAYPKTYSQDRSQTLTTKQLAERLRSMNVK